ncbi:hypothetical protein [Streptomyces sp. NPDC005388]
MEPQGASFLLYNNTATLGDLWGNTLALLGARELQTSAAGI